ncbi:MAG: DUF126 domain-containing protein [Euryarchaeota archaeon]|nr:DUF126 domain-containing protein [Euryarchaeota archaeon]
MRIKGRIISKGTAEGEAILTKEAITFLGGVDPRTGTITEKGHELEGKSIAGKILVFPGGKGSTVGSYVIYQMKKNGTAPKGMIALHAEQVVAAGAIISDLPMLDSLEKNPFEFLKNGMRITINADKGYVNYD